MTRKTSRSSSASSSRSSSPSSTSSLTLPIIDASSPPLKHELNLSTVMSEGWTLLSRHLYLALFPLIISMFLTSLLTAKGDLSALVQNWQGESASFFTGRSSLSETALIMGTSFLIFLASAFPVATSLVDLRGHFYSPETILREVTSSFFTLLLAYLLMSVLNYLFFVLSVGISYLLGFISPPLAAIVFILLKALFMIPFMVVVTLLPSIIVGEKRNAWISIARTVELYLRQPWKITLLILAIMLGGEIAAAVMFSLFLLLGPLFAFSASIVTLSLFHALAATCSTYIFWKVRSFP